MNNNDHGALPVRQHERHVIDLAAMMRYDGRSFDCQLLNISVSGARVRASRHFLPGLRLQIAILPFGEFACQVVWQKDDRTLGINFLESEAEMYAVLQAMSVV